MPQVLCYIAYGAATIFHVFCAMMILMYGMTFDPGTSAALQQHELMATTLSDIANEWLGMAIFTTLNDWLVSKPIAFLKVHCAADLCSLSVLWAVGCHDLLFVE